MREPFSRKHHSPFITQTHTQAHKQNSQLAGILAPTMPFFLHDSDCLFAVLLTFVYTYLYFIFICSIFMYYSVLCGSACCYCGWICNFMGMEKVVKNISRLWFMRRETFRGIERGGRGALKSVQQIRWENYFIWKR